MRRLTALAAAGLLAALAAWPAGAATTTVTVADFSFSPATAAVSMGTTVEWTNDGPSIHTSTQNSPLSKWNTGNIASGASQSVEIDWAGTYPYHCNIHPTMTGRIRVPVEASPAYGGVGDTFTIRLATVAAPSDFTYDVQRKVGSGAWKAFKTGVTRARLRFMPKSTGTYAFRSRLHRTSSDGTSGWSPADSIKVS